MIQFEAVVEASADTAGQGGERHQSGHRRREEGDGEQRQRPEYRRHLGWSGDAASARRQQATVDSGGLARVVDEQTLGLGVVCAVAVVVPGAVALSSCAMTEASWRRCCKTAPEKVDAEGDAARRLEERSRMVSGRRVWERSDAVTSL